VLDVEGGGKAAVDVGSTVLSVAAVTLTLL
jgi:hypothetical protein